MEINETDAVTGALAIFALSMVASVIFAVGLYVLISVPLAALFKKAGIEPWKAWVPYYSTFTWLELGGQSGWWVLASVVPGAGIVVSILLFIGMWSTGKAFGKDVGMLVLGILLPVVWLFILGFGSDKYQPERIAAAGLTPPRVGFGAVRPASYQQPA